MALKGYSHTRVCTLDLAVDAGDQRRLPLLKILNEIKTFPNNLNEGRQPVGLTPACSDCEIAALGLTLKMQEKWNVKLSILCNKYDFVDPSFLKLGRCLDLCPGKHHYIELHLINVSNLVSLMEKDTKKKCQMRRG